MTGAGTCSEKRVGYLLVRKPNSENCLNFIFVASHCEKVIFVSDENYITYAIRKFMFDMPAPGRFQNIGL